MDKKFTHLTIFNNQKKLIKYMQLSLCNSFFSTKSFNDF